MALDPTLSVLLGRLAVALQSLAVFLVVVAVVYLPGRLLVVPLLERLADAADVDQTLKLPLLKVSGTLSFLLGVYLALPLSGLATTPTTIAALSAGATIAVGFASRDVLNNLVSGIFLVLDPAFHIGDWVQWNDREGVVEDVGYRVTRVHTFDNELVTVPNSELASTAVTNPGAKDRRRIVQDFGIGYDEDVDEARRHLVEVAAETEAILDRPATSVLVAELADSFVRLRARFWIADPARADIVAVRSEYAQRVTERLDEAGVEMPYPHTELTGEVGTWAATPPDGDGPGGTPGSDPG